MADSQQEFSRPPIGFVVEGQGEYNCYPSLACRIVSASGVPVPIVNAGGCGNIVRNLPGQLRSLALAAHPREVIVTLDLRDVLSQRLYPDCASLAQALAREAASWLRDAVADARLHPLPARVSVVIQVQAFETWFIADSVALHDAGLLKAAPPRMVDVDAEVQDPVSWLRARLDRSIDIKNPRHARRVVASLDPKAMRSLSPSFDKFAREVETSYANWLLAAGFMGPASAA